MKKSIAALLLFLSFAATAQKAQKDPYLGVSKAQILVWFGQPEQKTANAKGEVLTFLRTRTPAGSSHRMPTMPPDDRDPRKRTETYKFFFNKKEVVYSWKVDTL